MTGDAVGRGGGEGPRVRDHLANTRTMLAWMRLAIALLTVGYSLDRLGVLEQQRHLTAVNPYRAYGIGSVGAGALLATAALVRYLWQRDAIESATFRTGLGADVAIIAGLGIGGLILIVLIAAVR